MALKVMVSYRRSEMAFDVIKQENAVYCLRMSGDQHKGMEYIPQKMIIRRKGKIWVSDVETHAELMALLTAEVKQLNGTAETLPDD